MKITNRQVLTVLGKVTTRSVNEPDHFDVKMFPVLVFVFPSDPSKPVTSATNKLLYKF